MHATSVLSAQALLGEGAIWNPASERLYWVDIEGRALHVFDPATGHDRRYPVGQRIGTVVPRRTGNVLVALQTGIHEIDLDTGRLTLLADPLRDQYLRFNDGKCDPAGRLWAGTFDLLGRPHAGTLYRFDPDGSTHAMLRRITNSNGLAWAPDHATLYYIDTPTLAVQAFDYDNRTGGIRNPRVIIRIAEGLGGPDGMTIDAEGKLWIAIWGAGRVHCYDPATGALVQVIEVPAPFTSSCAFGGPGLETLFITTARGGLTAAQLREFPLSGDVFAVRPGVAGVPACFFGE